MEEAELTQLLGDKPGILVSYDRPASYNIDLDAGYD